MATLAIEGGDRFRKDPFPERTPFGDREIDLLAQAVKSQNLFGPRGTMVGRFEDRFAASSRNQIDTWQQQIDMAIELEIEESGVRIQESE